VATSPALTWALFLAPDNNLSGPVATAYQSALTAFWLASATGVATSPAYGGGAITAQTWQAIGDAATAYTQFGATSLARPIVTYSGILGAAGVATSPATSSNASLAGSVGPILP
jgi:hypothetical protein